MLESRKQISRYISQGLDAKDDIVSWNKEKSTEIKIRRYHQILKYKLVRKSIFANIREQGDRIVFIGIIALTIIIGKNKGYEETRIIALYLIHKSFIWICNKNQHSFARLLRSKCKV